MKYIEKGAQGGDRCWVDYFRWDILSDYVPHAERTDLDLTPFVQDYFSLLTIDKHFVRSIINILRFAYESSD